MGRPDVSRLPLEPLPAGHLQRLVCSRLGIAELPETLARAVTERADGNALFAEEIVSYLTEGGALTVGGGKVKFDPAAVSGALLVSLQSLLASVGRLSPERRAALQAASAIGRRFDPQLLAAATE